ncbi:unnamed protein product [Ascophyllum nodosum]
MDQLIFASLSHTHYWYEVGMLKVPAVRVAPWEGLADECHKKRLLHCAGETFLSFYNILCFQFVHPHVLQVFPTYSYSEQDSCKIYKFEAIVFSTLFPGMFCL